MQKIQYTKRGDIVVAERGEYRILFIPDDLGMKYRVQSIQSGKWKTVFYAGTHGECETYINKANYGKEN